ncbi:MAG: DUF5320 domain-containing protein [Nanoarchaeota archaeon]|nr:DUF5320 domain-containing protein [Nanoarchaeota archaeon]
MPGRDQTGPNGMGRMGERGMGPCGKGMMYGRGFGRGCGFRQTITKEEEIEILKQEKESINKKLEELE